MDTMRLVDKTGSALLPGQPPAWSFDVVRGVYVNTQTGEPLSNDALRAAVTAVILGAKREADYLMANLTSGLMDVRVWRDSMQLLIDGLHAAMSAAATAGIPGMRDTAEADLRATLAREHAHLAGFLVAILALLGVSTASTESSGGAGVIANLIQLQGDEAYLANRAGSYMDAGLMTFERLRYKTAVFLDFAEAKRELHPEAEHCPGCDYHAGLGWVPIAQFVPLGLEECGQWCACTVEYRKLIPYIGGLT